MRKLSEIEILQATLNSTKGYIVLFVLTSFAGLCMLLYGLLYIEFSDNRIYRVLILVGTIFLVMTVAGAWAYINENSPMIDELNELIEQRSIDLDNKLKSMSCNELRLDIISILEEDKEQYIEDKLNWEQDYYYAKCEVPLREEVLKLQ